MNTQKKLTVRWTVMAFVAMLVWFGAYGALVAPDALPPMITPTGGGALGALATLIVLPRVLDIFLIPALVGLGVWIVTSAPRGMFTAKDWYINLGGGGLIGAALFAALFGVWAGMIMVATIVAITFVLSTIFVLVGSKKTRQSWRSQLSREVLRVKMFVGGVLFGWKPKMVGRGEALEILEVSDDGLEDLIKSGRLLAHQGPSGQGQWFLRSKVWDLRDEVLRTKETRRIVLQPSGEGEDETLDDDLVFDLGDDLDLATDDDKDDAEDEGFRLDLDSRPRVCGQD